MAISSPLSPQAKTPHRSFTFIFFSTSSNTLDDRSWTENSVQMKKMAKLPTFFFSHFEHYEPLDSPLDRLFCFQQVPSHLLTVSLLKVYNPFEQTIKLKIMAKFWSFLMILGPCKGPQGSLNPWISPPYTWWQYYLFLN